MSNGLIAPHGGKLVDAMVEPDRAEELKSISVEWPSWDLTHRQLNDLELLLVGGFSPLTGFMTREDYEPVRDDMRLASGLVWPMPITLDVTEEFAAQVAVGDSIAVRDAEGVMLAALHIEDLWTPDRTEEARKVFATDDPDHPGVGYLLHQSNPVYLGGRIEGTQLPIHHDFKAVRLSPVEVRADLERMGSTRVVAFQTRNPMHRAHVELTIRAAKEVEADLLIHPVVGLTKPGDVDHYARVRAYQLVLARYPRNTAKLALLPLAMRMGGPREAVWHALIRKNYGVTHFIVGRDHAGPGSDANGEPFYGPYEAQELVAEYADEIGVSMVPFKLMVYVEDRDAYMPVDEVPEDSRSLSISGTELRDRLATGRDIPEWFTFGEVAEELRKTYPPRSKQGFTVFFTGLSGSGKSTIANALLVKLLELGGRPVTLLDGDVVRKNLSSELGFSKEHRDLNILRIGYVASEITKNGGIAICAPIAPYDHTRKANRDLIEGLGGFVLVHIATPIEVCETRDRKGLYAKARAGLIKGFTGIDDPYEEPADADLVIDTTLTSADRAAHEVILHLESEGYIGLRRDG